MVSAADGAMPQTREHILLCRQVGVKSIIVYINKCDLISDPEMHELVEMEVRELLTQYEYDGDNTIFIKGSALAALNGEDSEIGTQSIKELVETMDKEVPVPQRQDEKDFLMSIESSLNIAGRGCVVTGTIEQGKCKVNDEVHMIGITRRPRPTTIIGIESFKKSLDFGFCGDNVGVLLRGILKEQVKRGMILVKPVINLNLILLGVSRGQKKL